MPHEKIVHAKLLEWALYNHVSVSRPIVATTMWKRQNLSVISSVLLHMAVQQEQHKTETRWVAGIQLALRVRAVHKSIFKNRYSGSAVKPHRTRTEVRNHYSQLQLEFHMALLTPCIYIYIYIKSQYLVRNVLYNVLHCKQSSATFTPFHLYSVRRDRRTKQSNSEPHWENNRSRKFCTELTLS